MTRAIFVSLLVLGLLLTPTLGATASTAQSDSACPPPTTPIPPVSASTATTLALASPQFLQAVSDQTFHFGGAAVWWQCGKPENIDANFIVANSTGFQEDAVVAFNLTGSYAPSNVYGRITVMPVIKFTTGGGSSYSEVYWSGYQFCNGHNSGGAYCSNTPNVLQGVSATWTQPNVYAPTGSNQPGCGTVYCNAAVWTGLDDCAPGGCDLLQTGSVGYIRLCPFCITSYALFWQDFPASSATFCTKNVAAGDTISSVVDLYTGNSYYVYSSDSQTGGYCSSNPFPYAWSHTPYWGDFIVERGMINNGRDLAKFNNFYLQGEVEASNSWAPINRYFGNLWYDMEYMQNSGVYNVCSGSWAAPSTCSSSVISGSPGYGEFSNTWISSQNT